MKKLLIFIHIVYILLFVYGSLFAIGEKTISIGGSSTWSSAEKRSSVTEARAVRPNPVLLLSSVPSRSVVNYSSASGVSGNFYPMSESALDLFVSFDERDAPLFKDSVGNYKLTIPSDVGTVERSFARAGSGAAFFGKSGMDAASGPMIIQPYTQEALFAPGNRIRDFTIEFWLNPLNIINGEQIFTWTAVRPVNGNMVLQRISCDSSRNRLKWSFTNFFASVTGTSHMNIELTGDIPVVPKTWSHHLIRFDASSGLLEYLVDGRSETIVYATSTGRESSEVFTPIIGNNGSFLIGEHFTGLMDELKIHSVCAGKNSMSRYTPAGGRIETRAVDLGQNSSGVIRVNASGGRTSVRGSAVRNEFKENGRFRFSDDSEMNFFIRASENPYLLSSSLWVNFVPGSDISNIRGRYVQIAVDFYPSADGETSPYLEELRIVFIPGEPPLPPRNLTATAVDGGVILRWRHSPASNTAGYLVYYSSVRGELFGNDAKLGSSPINAGLTNNIHIEGLSNGTLYYFKVASYDIITGEINYNVGEFSAEVTARPLSGLNP